MTTGSPSLGNGSGAEPLFVDEPINADVDLRLYVEIVRRRWKWVVACGILAVVLSIVLQRNQVTYPLYTANVLVQRIPDQAQLNALGVPAALRPSDDITSEIEILKTTQVLGAVVDSLGLRVTLSDPSLRSQIFDQIQVSPEAASREYRLVSDGGAVQLMASGEEVARAGADGMLLAPGLDLLIADASHIPSSGLTLRVTGRMEAGQTLGKALKATQVQRTNLIRIDYTHADPVTAARVANALAAAYQGQAAIRAREDAMHRREFLAGRLTSVNDSLRIAQTQLLDFQAQRQTVDPESEGQALSGVLVGAEQDLRKVEQQERTLQDVLATLGSGTPEGLRQMTILSGDLLPGTQDLFNRLQQYQDRRNNLINGSGRTQNSPDVQLLDSLITETKGEMRLTVEQALRLTHQNVVSAQSRVGELRTQVGDVPQRNVAFGRLEQRVQAIQKMHDLLSERFYEAQISEATEAGNIEIVDPATVPSQPSGTSGRRVHPLLALLAGLILGFGCAVGYEMLDTKVHKADEVRRHTGAPILGVIPQLAMENGKARQVLVARDGDIASEAFRMLRTNMRFARAQEPRMILVTSAEPGDGKSIVSSNLAIALAQEGRKVLLIDADLRRPVQHTIFGQHRSPGMTDILVGEKAPNVIRKTAHGIDVLTAGTVVPNPAELVGATAFQRLLDQSLERYDMIILDTPPILAVSDTSMMIASVDAVILVARQDRTQREALKSAADQLRRARASLLGVVVNGVDNTNRYYGGYGYAYGYRTAEYLAGENGSGNGNGNGKKKSAKSRLKNLGVFKS